jgi:hypothetical protein
MFKIVGNPMEVFTGINLATGRSCSWSMSNYEGEDTGGYASGIRLRASVGFLKIPIGDYQRRN